VASDHSERFAGLPRRPLADGMIVVEARTSRARRRGLARLEALPDDHALLIPRCPAVHTFGMRFPLDLIWLGKDESAVRVDWAVPPKRMRACARARSVVETLAGRADAFLSAGVGVALVRELQSPVIGPGGAYLPAVVDPAAVRSAADDYATRNHGRVLDMQIIPGATGDDVTVTVQTLDTTPNGSVDAGAAAVRQARASSDPFSSAAPLPVATCDASLATGPRFVSHGGQYGFFPAPTANYTVGSEPEIAARLDKLGEALHLHLTGLSGFRTPGHSVEVGGTADDPHTCGAASDTPGIEQVPESTLQQYGLTRPFPGDPREADHIQLAGTTGSVCLTGGGASVNVSLSLGNPNVHLVPLTGGPQGSALGFPSLAASAGWSIPWAVVSCESGGRNTMPNSASASGYYQITSGTWGGYGGYPAAYLAPKSVQDAKAAQLIATRGLQPWVSSEPCWGPVIGFRV
jgi:uncharacterized membrane protein (UPF0127 family)